VLSVSRHSDGGEREQVPVVRGVQNLYLVSHLNVKLVLLLLVGMTSMAKAGFELNFNAYSGATRTGYFSLQNCGGFDGKPDRPGDSATCIWSKGGGTYKDTTSWRMEVAVIGGYEYWHQLVGDNNTAFRQEAYIRMGPSRSYMHSAVLNWGLYSDQGFSDSGGFPSGLIGRQYDGMMVDPTACEVYLGNACDPLGHANTVSHNKGDNQWTGNGTGNPTRAVFRTIVEDAANGFYQENLKDQEGMKPRITQTLNSSGIAAEFQADMRNIGYTNMNSPLSMVSALNSGSGTFVNKLRFTDSDITSFDMASDTQAGHSKINAGRYTFNQGLGWQATGTNSSYWATYYNGKKYNNGAMIYGFDFFSDASGHIPIYNPGTYSYADGSFDVNAVDYGRFMDPAQNPCGGNPFC
jgi:hypothetical protein